MFQIQNEFQKLRQIKKEIKEKNLVVKNKLCNQTPLWKHLRKYEALDHFNIPITYSSTIFILQIANRI